jgi:hypothetical protein
MGLMTLRCTLVAGMGACFRTAMLDGLPIAAIVWDTPGWAPAWGMVIMVTATLCLPRSAGR